MAGCIDWFRWHHGSVTDPKFKLIAACFSCNRAKADRSLSDWEAVRGW